MRKFSNFNKPKVLIPLFIIGVFVFSMWLYGAGNREPILKDSSQDNQYSTISEKSKYRSTTDLDTVKFTRNTSNIDYSSVTFSPWDVKAASVGINRREPKPYTIMVYMNGSDLESENGAATDDLIEMLESGLSSDNANLVLFTGGTNRWQNDVIPDNECMIWEIKDGQIYELAGVGLVNMGNSGTLASFIDFGLENFPADKYGLVLWDHGGGSIAGYGHDEKFDNDNLSLLDMNYAFENSSLSNAKLEFLGFDSCLMSSVEMGVIASDYAKYLIASEDLTPGDGWDYHFLSVLNDNPFMDGAAFGAAITDYFIDYYGFYSDEDLNMSVVDLSNINNVMYAMGKLMQKAYDNLTEDKIASFRALARRRSGTRTFGLGSPRDNESDMVDIGDMAYKLSDLYPKETDELFVALEEAVVYNRHNSDIFLSGLSTFYIYGGRNSANESLNTYTALSMDDGYTRFLHNFSNILLSNNIFRQNTRSRSNQAIADDKDNLTHIDLTIWRPVNNKQNYYIMTGIKNDVDDNSDENISAAINEPWPTIEGKYVCLYKISDSGGHLLYAVPAEVNGRSCDIILLICENYPNGKILGARYEDGFIIQKGYDELKVGDRVSFYYPIKYFGDNSSEESGDWFKSDEFTVNGEPTLKWQKLESNNHHYSLRLVCIQNEEHFTDLQPVQIQ